MRTTGTSSGAGLVVEPVDHQDRAAVAAWFEVLQAVEQELRPGEPGWTLNEQWGVVSAAAAPAAPVLLRDWVVREGPTVLAAGRLELPQHDNREHAQATVLVRAGERRQGIGARLLHALEEAARTEGRSVVQAEVQRSGTPDADGDRFARRHGYHEVLEDERRSLAVPLDQALAPALEAEAVAASRAYRLTSWQGDTPPDLLDARARLCERISRDAPSGGSTREGERWDADRVRADDAKVRAMRRRGLSVVAVHDASAEVVGFTMVTITVDGPEPAPQAWQWDTVVEPAHRGHRLGLRLKVANLRQLHEAFPACRRVLTWNAASNVPMIAVNDRLGARVDARMRTYERAL